MIERKGARTLAELRAFYDSVYARTAYGEKPALYRMATKLLEVKPGERVLDVGCGAGPFLAAVVEAGGEPWGLDLSGQALAKARALVPQARLLQADGERLPFASGSFPRVACLGNLEHFMDPSGGARELARVVAPGGLVLVHLPNSRYSGDLWRRLLGGSGPDHHQLNDRFATCDEWKDLLEKAGLRVQNVERWDKGKRWKRIFPFGLAHHYLYVCRAS